MTLTCAGKPDCPMCRTPGEVDAYCRACNGSAVLGTCFHDTIERHNGMPAIGRSDTREDIIARTPTKPNDPILADKIEVEVSDREGAVHALRLAATIIERWGKITIIIQK